MMSIFLQRKKPHRKGLNGEGTRLRLNTPDFHSWRERGMIRRYEGYMQFSMGRI
jgi:hypothetical protein